MGVASTNLCSQSLQNLEFKGKRGRAPYFQEGGVHLSSAFAEVLSRMDTNIPTTNLDLWSSLKTLKINPEIMFYLLVDTKMSQSDYS